MKSTQVSMFLLTVMLISVCLLSACGSTKNELPWAVLSDGRFNTRDLARAQKEVPFTIIVPSYLPANLAKYPSIAGHIKCASPECGNTSIVIYYPVAEGEEKGVILVRVTEGNDPSLAPFDPALVLDLTDYTNMEIDGVEVVIRQDSVSLAPVSPSISIKGWIFWWNKDGIYFEVAIYDQDWDTTTRIIESMIQQMQ
jgi:hypothetical protein